MALKERLDALKRPEDTGRGLSVIPGRQPEAVAAPTPTPDESAQKSGRGPNSFAGSKAAIHALLVERHADEIDIGDREGVRRLIASLAEEYIRTASVALTRLDYGHLLDALLDEVLGLGPLQPLLEDPAISEVMINHSRQVFVERSGRVMLSPVVFAR
jgi:pilus assembly protein CpaF